MSTALRTYYRGHSLVGLRDEVGAATRYYHFDHQGTTQCLTDSTGAVTDRFAADAWGVQVKRTGSSINRHWYIGNLGYYRNTQDTTDYVRERWFRVHAGIWVSRDPFHRTDAYLYANNTPALLTDPSGFIPQFPCFTDGEERPDPCQRKIEELLRIWGPVCTSRGATWQRCEIPRLEGEHPCIKKGDAKHCDTVLVPCLTNPSGGYPQSRREE